MKTLAEIKRLTQQALDEKAEQKRLAELKAKEQEQKDHDDMVKRAKDVSFFFGEIEEAAKEGKNTYSISIGHNDESEYHKLKIKYITELLKDFNPTFTEEREVSYSYDWEGGRIDGSESYYIATHVHFNW